jgi:DNA-binding MarR family transcriptional regulator
MIQIYRFRATRKRQEKMAKAAREKDGKPRVSAGTAAIEHELATLARVLEAAQRKRAYPLERAEFIILRRLAEAGPQNVGALARALLLDDSTMTRQVAALEEKKLVARRPDPADRRAGLIAVTPAGEKAMEEMRGLRAARIGGYVAKWTEAERRTLARLLARLNATLIESLSG